MVVLMLSCPALYCNVNGSVCSPGLGQKCVPQSVKSSVGVGLDGAFFTRQTWARFSLLRSKVLASEKVTSWKLTERPAMSSNRKSMRDLVKTLHAVFQTRHIVVICESADTQHRATRQSSPVRSPAFLTKGKKQPVPVIGVYGHWTR